MRLLWRELHLEDTVRWLGDVTASQLAAEYNRADVFSLPSIQEGFGIVFLEAMAAGKPIVATRAAAVPEVVRHGLLVEPENHDALADALETSREPVPLHLRNAATPLMKHVGYGQGYRYVHSDAAAKDEMECLPEPLRGKKYFDEE